MDDVADEAHAVARLDRDVETTAACNCPYISSQSWRLAVLLIVAVAYVGPPRPHRQHNYWNHIVSVRVLVQAALRGRLVVWERVRGHGRGVDVCSISWWIIGEVGDTMH